MDRYGSPIQKHARIISVGLRVYFPPPPPPAHRFWYDAHMFWFIVIYSNNNRERKNFIGIYTQWSSLSLLYSNHINWTSSSSICRLLCDWFVFNFIVCVCVCVANSDNKSNLKRPINRLMMMTMKMIQKTQFYRKKRILIHTLIEWWPTKKKQ